MSKSCILTDNLGKCDNFFFWRFLCFGPAVSTEWGKSLKYNV